MSSLGDIQKKLLSVLADAKSQGYSLKEALPEELQDDLHGVAELKTARAYIKELEDCEKDLQAKNDNLSAELKEKKTETENQREEFKALQADLQQFRRSAEYYKQIADDAEVRVQRCQRTLTTVMNERKNADDLTANIERLQAQVSHHESTIRKLQDENRTTSEMFDYVRAQDAQKLAAQDAQLKNLSSHAAKVETESDQFSETFSKLIEMLENENEHSAATVNDKSTLLQQMQKLYNVLVSEVTPLNRFFTNASTILGFYQDLFHSLADPATTIIAHLPKQMDGLMASIAQDLEIYDVVHGAFSTGAAGSLAEEAVRMQVSGMGESAQSMFASMKSVKVDATRCLARLHAQPGAWLTMKAKLRGSIAGKSKRFSLGHQMSAWSAGSGKPRA